MSTDNDFSRAAKVRPLWFAGQQPVWARDPESLHL